MQLMKGRTSLTELLPFGEHVLFKIPKTGDAIGSFEDRWDSGIWLGCNVRDGMHLVGTRVGVFKVGTLQRKLDGEQWSADLVCSIVGRPQRPEPNTESRRITTFAKNKLLEKPDRPEVQYRPAESAMPEPRQIQIMKKDIEKYGATEGCPGCNAIVSRKAWRAAHTPDCRKRIEAAMMADDEDRNRIRRTAERFAHHVEEGLFAEEEEKRGILKT